MKMQKSLYYIVPTLVVLLWACIPTRPPSEKTLPEESVVATERWIQTQNALTQTVLPTVTPILPFAHLPALTPIPNSTSVGNGAYFDVPVDVLGPKYEIENAYYFDKLETGERYEFYAGAIWSG